MKKLSIAVKSFFAGALIIGLASCSNGNGSAATAAPATGDSLSTATACGLNIRYIDADSIFSAYVLAQDLLQEQQREMNKLQQWHESKQRELQAMANKISQRQQNSTYLSQESMQADVNELQKKGEEAERYLNTQQQRLANADLQIRQRLNDSIMNFINSYNAVKGYDAILLREAGVYFKPELNITAEVVEGLNARYNATAAQGK